MSHAYRSAYDHIVGQKLAETERAEAEIAPHLPALRRILRARIARIVAGLVGILGAVLMVIAAIADDDQTPTFVLLTGVVGALATYLTSRTGLGLATWLRTRLAKQELALTGELEADLARIDASDPTHELHGLERKLARVEAASVAVPLSAITLLAPLMLHFLFVALTDWRGMHSYASWIRISIVIVGHAHLALALMCVLFARKLRRSSLDQLRTMKIHREWLRAWGITIAVACVPGIVMLLVPPVLVAVTAITFVPAMFITFHRHLLAERSALDLAAHDRHVRIADDPAAAAVPGEELTSEELTSEELAPEPEPAAVLAARS